jgi:hypothetical protein
MLLNSVYALLLQSAITGVLDVLNGFAADPLFAERFELVFGKSISSSGFQAALANLPQFEVRSDGDLAGALGAFSAQTQKIYLTESLLTGDPVRLQAVMIEEIGHFLDAQVNTVDTAGDEGELFSDLVRGVSLSSAELGRIQAEDDHAVIVIDGQEVAIEQNVQAENLLDAKKFLDDQDKKNNFLYENVQTINPGVFRSRFKTIAGNTAYNPIPGIVSGGLNTISSPFNSTSPQITPLGTTVKGLLIHTFSTTIWNDNITPNTTPAPNLASDFTNKIGDVKNTGLRALNSLFAEGTFNGTPVNLGNLSNNGNGPIKVHWCQLKPKPLLNKDCRMG